MITRTEKETIKLGKIIAEELRPGDVIALFGNLGSGKTTLTKGIARGIGIKQNKINSPTFVLVKEYKGRIPLYHMDLYRLNDNGAVEREGLADYLNDDGIVVIEWAEKMGELLPKEYLRIDLKIRDRDEREINLTSAGKRYRKLIRKNRLVLPLA